MMAAPSPARVGASLGIIRRNTMSATTIKAFDTTLQLTNAWLHELSEEMGTDDRHRAYHALRAVLHALRDRLERGGSGRPGGTTAAAGPRDLLRGLAPQRGHLNVAPSLRTGPIPPGKWGTQIVFWSPVTKVKAENERGDPEDDRFVSGFTPSSAGIRSRDSITFGRDILSPESPSPSITSPPGMPSRQPEQVSGTAGVRRPTALRELHPGSAQADM